MSKELLVNLKEKNKVHRMWKRGQATWEEYRNLVRTFSDAARLRSICN